jgi:microcystin-dependent protein
MGLESATYIADLVDTNPAGSDLKSQGDNHIRMIKDVLQNTFPGATRACPIPTTSVENANFTILAADQNTTFLVTTAGGEVTGTLPTLASGDAGWVCHFIKTNVDLNALFVAPASGTLQSGEVSGLAQARRVIPGIRTDAFWTGTAWVLSRACGAPIGTLLDFSATDLPVGYEFAYGQTLTSGSTKYPEFYSVNGSSAVVMDLRGRVAAGQDDMGGSSANRLTAVINGDTFGAVGGADTITLTEAQLAAHDHGAATTVTVNGEVTDHTHDMSFGLIEVPTGPGSGSFALTAGTGSANKTSAGRSTNHTHVSSVTVESDGGGTAHNNLQPTIIVNKILVVE